MGLRSLLARYQEWADTLDVFKAVRVIDATPGVEAGLVLLALFLILALRTKRAALVSACVVLAVLAAGLEFVNRDLAGRIGDGSARMETVRAMLARAGDHWPRGVSHAPLGRIGVKETEKGYLEPGGSFSPAPGSFGVSFWAFDASGTLLATSDDIPLDRTRSRYVSSDVGEPGVVTETPYFIASWTAKDDGSYALDLARLPTAARLAVVFRGVGPAGGPLRSIQRESDTLQFDSGWRAGAISTRSGADARR